MSKPRKPTRTFRVAAYDGDYKSLDMLPKYSNGHRVQDTYLKQTYALQAAAGWIESHPPCTNYNHCTQPFCSVEEIITRTGDVYRLATWIAQKNDWTRVR